MEQKRSKKEMNNEQKEIYVCYIKYFTNNLLNIEYMIAFSGVGGKKRVGACIFSMVYYKSHNIFVLLGKGSKRVVVVCDES